MRVRQAQQGGGMIVLVHERDEAKGAVSFDSICSVTPDDLIRKGLYAPPCGAAAQRRAPSGQHAPPRGESGGADGRHERGHQGADVRAHRGELGWSVRQPVDAKMAAARAASHRGLHAR